MFSNCWVPSSKNIPEASDVYALNRRLVWYMNQVSTELFKKVRLQENGLFVSATRLL